MKNKLFVVLALSLLTIAACQSGNKNETDLDKLNIKGDVARITELSYEALEEGDKVSKGEAIYFRYENHYDEKGNKTKDLKYDNDGKLKSRYIYHYDTEGRRQNEQLRDAQDSLIREIRFTYTDGLLTEDQSFDASGTAGKKYTYIYNEEGQMIKQEIYTAEGDLGKYFTFAYNEKGQRSKETKFLWNDEVVESYHYSYDEQGNVQEEKVRGNKEELLETYRYEYQYDDQDNWIKKVVYGNEIPLLLIEREIGYR